jgi:hypothetical protein
MGQTDELTDEEREAIREFARMVREQDRRRFFPMSNPPFGKKSV